MDHQLEHPVPRSSVIGAAVGLRVLGIVLPLLINYGSLLVASLAGVGFPGWATTTLSLAAAAIPLVVLAERGDKGGAAWIGGLYLPLNAYALTITAISGATQ